MLSPPTWEVNVCWRRSSTGDAFGLYPSRPGVAAALNEEGAIAGYDVIVDLDEAIDNLAEIWNELEAEYS